MISVPVVTLIRHPPSDQGTPGGVYIGGQLLCCSMELPDRNNAPNLSRIPAGVYRCVWHWSPRFGWVYLVTGVPGRSHILIHPGNLAGDVRQGFITHSHGCLLFGDRLGTLAGQLAVLNSRPAVRRFATRMNQQSFDLEIHDGHYSFAA